MKTVRRNISGPCAWRICPLGLCLLLLTALCTHSSAAPRETNQPPARREFASFKIITDKNIFNANRSRRADRSGGETRRAARTQTITLVGTMTYDRGMYAFFDGSASEFRKALEPGKSIAGHKIIAVKHDGVRLAAGTNEFDLIVGMQLRREDEGDWKVVPGSGTAAPVAASPSEAPGEENDIVKKLMQQREQELK